MKTFKKITPVLAGFLTVVILSVGTDTVLEKLGIFPPASNGLFVTWMLIVALIYRCVYTVIGGYVTARLAQNNPMKHVRILCIIGLIGGAAGVVFGWSLSAHWYPIAIFVTAFPLTWFGGTLFAKNG